jgi:acetyl esterase/lipase
LRHRYGDDPSQFGELFAPDDGGPFPVAVVLHGGFWRSHFTRKLMWPVCGALVTRGWAAFNLEYRRLGFGSGGGWPATCDDVAAGVRLAASLPQVDASRMVAIGHSAGGQLALWVAAQGLGVRAVVSQAGVADLELAWDLGLSGTVVERFLGGDRDALAVASPRCLAPLGVPSLALHGSEDDVVPVVVARSFADADPDCELRVLEGEDHFGHIDPANGLWRAAADWIEPWR